MLASDQAPHTSMHDMEEVVHGILKRIHPAWLERRHYHRFVLAIYGFSCCFLSFGIIATLAKFTQSLTLIPSLGSTAFLFFYTPTAPSAAPRNALLGHAIAVGAGYLSLVVMRIVPNEAMLQGVVSWQEVLASALALASASGMMILLDAPHPPAAATALIIALGVLRQPMQVAGLFGGVILLIVIAIALNRFAGVPYPLWAKPITPPASAH